MDRLAATSHRANDRYMRQFDGPPGSAPVARASDLGSVGATIERAGTSVSSSASCPFRPNVTRGWWAGPVDPRGALIDLSDRPVLCGAVDCERGVAYVGCSDHAAYAIATEHGKKSATLYGKRAGHSEWVTGVALLGDSSGRVVTCGMDGKLIVWAPPAGAASRAGPSAASHQVAELTGHFGSVSAVACGPSGSGWGHVVVSAGYDKTLRVWLPDTGTSPHHKLVGHDAPVLVLGVAPAAGVLLAASGDREGVVRTWDCAAGRPLAELRGHRGHLTSLEWLCDRGAVSASAAPPLLATGAQDGHVRVWDSRAAAPAANVPVHVAGGGSGAVSEIRFLAPCESFAAGLVVTIGADKTVCALDPRSGFSVLHRFTEHRDFPYSLAVSGGIAFSGAGDGLLIAHDLASGRALWGLGANAAAVRFIGVVGKRLFAAGDDGKAIVYSFAE